MPPWLVSDPGHKVVRFKAGRVEYILDLGCGTATSAALYYLLFYPNAVVLGIDRDQDEAWVRGHLPSWVQSRFFFVNADVRDLSVARLDELVREHLGVPLSKLARIHWSPSCVTLSRASRGWPRYRDAFSSTTHPLSIADDEVFEAGVRLMLALCRMAPSLCCSIENPAGEHFAHLPGVRLLLRDRSWRLLCGSHCSNLCEADTGYWPQKDTFWLVNRVPRNFHLQMCDFDCEHLLPGTERHRVVLCTAHDNLPGQVVIRDPMIKGLIPLGVFKRIDAAHAEWRARVARRRLRVSRFSGEANVAARPSSDESETDSDEEAHSDSDEDDRAFESDLPLDEADYDDEGRYHPPKVCVAIRPGDASA